jgi:tetrahydromethanopterin S-methyltransferase subunit A
MACGLYPWGGGFTAGRADSCVAAVTLGEELAFPADRVALWGSMKTENLGVEKVVANVVSNPNIRFLIVCGAEVRGHRSGDSILCLHRSGIDSNNRVVGARSAIPFIENLPREAIDRFRRQVEVVDLVGVADPARIAEAVDACAARNPGPFGEALVVEPLPKDRVVEVFHAEYALHSKIDADIYGVVSPSREAR